MSRHGWTQEDHEALAVVRQRTAVGGSVSWILASVAALLAVLVILGVLFWAAAAQAQACRPMGSMIVCDNGQTFHNMGDGLVVDDWGNSWIEMDGIIHHTPKDRNPLKNNRDNRTPIVERYYGPIMPTVEMPRVEMPKVE